MDRERNDSGRYNDRIEPDTVLEVFESRDDRAEPLTASDVVDQMDIARRTAHNKLNELTERGVLETKKVGARGRVWWTPITESGQSSTRERSEGNNGDSPAPAQEPREPSPISDDELEEQLRSTLPGSGQTLEDRVNAVLTMYSHLRDRQGEIVQTGELKALVDGENLGYKNTDSFWNNAIKKNSAQDRPNSLTALSGVEELGNGRYQYTEE